MFKLTDGLVYLENKDFEMLNEMDMTLTPDYLASFFPRIGFADNCLSSLLYHGCSEYDIIRYASILSLVADKSYDTENYIYGYYIRIGSSGSFLKNEYITLDEIPIIQVGETNDFSGLVISYLNPAIIHSSESEYMLEAIIKSYSY